VQKGQKGSKAGQHSDLKELSGIAAWTQDLVHELAAGKGKEDESGCDDARSVADG
jgi:hypothetical protein